MLLQGWLTVCLIMGVAMAVPHQNMEESLRSVLDAIARKQRYLDTNSQEYLNDRPYKYLGGDGERKFDREHQGDREMEEEEEEEEEDQEINFLPNETGQLETVGNGFQDLNNKLLERALIDYLETVPQQEEPVTSLFRERERSSSRKRGFGPDRLNVDNKELAKLFLEELQNGSPYNVRELDDDGYNMNSRQVLYDRYRADQGNKLYETSSPMSWGELLNKESVIRGQGRETEENEYGDREQDPNLLYLSMGDRRNVNGGYPLRTYRNMAKRYPVAKRSPKPMVTKKQVTDPKVAEDLGALFGAQSTDKQNHTHNRDHDHDHNHDKDHDHSHDHDHDHEHGDQHKHENSSEAPKVTPAPKGQKENATKLSKSKNIEVRKKSVDWSQYFGIDRRRKKATFVAGQGTQNQDDEWMLQRYYENMVENLKANDRNYEKEANERNENQLDTKQKNIKDLIVEEALRYADSEDGIDLQKVKDKVMARMAAAYSFEKMRKALSDLRNNVAARIEAQKAAHAQGNQTSNFRENNSPNPKDKRTNNNLIDPEDVEESRTCPELEAIKKRCRTVDTLVGDESQMLYLPCVMLQICKACEQDDLEETCLGNYAVEAWKICDTQEIREGPKGRKACASTALILSQLQTPTVIADQCRMDGNDSCLRRYYHRYWHHYLNHPYSGRRLNGGYNMIGSQQPDR